MNWHALPEKLQKVDLLLLSFFRSHPPPKKVSRPICRYGSAANVIEFPVTNFYFFLHLYLSIYLFFFYPLFCRGDGWMLLKFCSYRPISGGNFNFFFKEGGIYFFYKPISERWTSSPIEFSQPIKNQISK